MVADLAKRLTGSWSNQLGSILELTADDEGGLKGTFRSPSGGAGGMQDTHSVTGCFDPSPDGRGGAVGFAVTWPATSSVTVWSGHYRDDEDLITTTWLLSGPCVDEEVWRSTLIGHDEFRKFPVEHGSRRVERSQS